MVVLTVDGLVLDVAERVVHPAHVPLEPEPQAARGGRLGHARPGGRLLRDRHDAGHPAVDGRIHLLDEGDGLEVLAPPELIGLPLAGLSRVVEVEHRRDRIDPKCVDVELLEPEHGVGDEEIAHLPAAEVEHVGAPVGVLAPHRVRMLVQRGAVESGERPVVLREVSGNPVDDDADTRHMQCVDEVAQVVGRSEARGRREVGRHLVAPGRAIRVLGHGQELDVREAGSADVLGELDCELAVGEPLPP